MMDTLYTMARRRLVSPAHHQVGSEDGVHRTGQERLRVLRALSAIARRVWPESCSEGGVTPFISAPSKHWPDGELLPPTHAG